MNFRYFYENHYTQFYHISELLPNVKDKRACNLGQTFILFTKLSLSICNEQVSSEGYKGAETRKPFLNLNIVKLLSLYLHAWGTC